VVRNIAEPSAERIVPLAPKTPADYLVNFKHTHDGCVSIMNIHLL